MIRETSAYEGLKEHNFREQCKSDLNFLAICYTKEIENDAPMEEEDCVKEYKEQKEITIAIS